MSNRATAREIFFMATRKIAANHISGLDEGGTILGERRANGKLIRMDVVELQ